MTSSHDLWIKRYRRVPRARARLLCFGHAGSSAAVFRPWAERLPETIELAAVELPGRGARRREPPLTRLEDLARALHESLSWDLPLPLALFGHSMGALVAFELARLLEGEPGRGPVHLFVSGHRAPHLPDRGDPLHLLPDDRFIQELRVLNGTPPEILDHAELLELMLPILRADFEVCETYVHRPGSPLICPISAFGGANDALLGTEDLAAWQAHTRGAFRALILPGDHFFVYQDPGALLAEILADMSAGPAASR